MRNFGTNAGFGQYRRVGGTYESQWLEYIGLVLGVTGRIQERLSGP